MQRIMIRDTVECVGETVLIKGWIHTRREMAKLSFLDVRDRSGLVQVVLIPSELTETSQAIIKDLRPEFCVAVTGVVQKRGEKQIHPHLETGTIEILAKDLIVLSAAKTLPFDIRDTSQINEELRLKYRYLDLRSSRMLRNITLRDKVTTFIRTYLHERGFLEIETPMLTKSTGETGAREFIVPARLHPGEFYALPQSPQQFKQLLMVAGIERYFQIARCFRDEDQRGDRQPDFTQLDLEMSFVNQEDVRELIEEMMIHLVKTCTPEKRIQQIPFPRLTYKEAMEKYGNDKPDLREDKNDPNLLAFCWVIDFPFFERTDEGGWTFTHNPFSSPMPEHMDWLMHKEHIEDILTTQYDIVLNGYEAGGGSIRNHQPEALHKVLEIIGMDEENIQRRFGHMLEAFAFGTPPHGGIAPGIDRIVMILANEPNIREVITFPKTGDARDVMMGAPSALSQQRLDDVSIQVKRPKA